MDWEELLGRLSSVVINDFRAVWEDYELGYSERQLLAQTVVGASHDNRDRPLFSLSSWLSAQLTELHGINDGRELLFHILYDVDAAAGSKFDKKPPRTLKGRRHRALLSFLASMDGYRNVEQISNALAKLCNASGTRESIGDFAKLLSRTIHAYRAQHLPYEAFRSDFYLLRRHYASSRPEAPLPIDGDALELWSEHGTRVHWTRHTTVLKSLLAFHNSQNLTQSTKTISDLARDTEGGTDRDWAQIASDDEAWQVTHDNGLTGAVIKISESPLGFVNAAQKKALEQLVFLDSAAQRWPVSSLTELVLSPVHNKLSGALRFKAKLSRQMFSASMNDCNSFDDVVQSYRSLSKLLSEFLVLLAKLRIQNSTREIDLGISNTIKESTRRLATLRNRSSLKTLSDNELEDTLMDHVTALVFLRDYIDRLVKNWSACSESKKCGSFDRAYEIFEMKLLGLYESEWEGVYDG